MSDKSNFEAKKMAIINLTCDYPFEYTIYQLARWVRVTPRVVKELGEILNLDIEKCGSGKRVKPISDKRKYLKNVFI